MALSKLFVRCAVFLSLLLFIAEAQPQTPQCSKFRFEFQPVAELPCNPYSDPDSVVLKCTIKGPFPPNDTYVTIAWFRRLDSEISVTGQELSAFEEENPSLIDIETNGALVDSSLVVTSTLKVNTLNVGGQNLTGMYWCVMRAGMETPIGNREYISLKSGITNIRSALAYESNVPCTDTALATDSQTCVAFQVLPEFLAPEINTEPAINVTTPQDRITASEMSEDDPLLDNTLIIVLSVVGASLCIIIHVLLAIVSCLCVKSRKKKHAIRASILDSRKVSIVSLLPQKRSSSPTLGGLPPLPQQPTTLPLSATTPTHPITGKILPSPPTHLPPAPVKRPPVLPKSNRASLPLRLSRGVNLADSSDDEVYEAVQVQVKSKRAATIAGDNIIAPSGQYQHDPFADDEAECKYKSLNRDMMNGHPVYEDPTVSAKMSASYNIDQDDTDDEDQEMDSIYQATILKNTQSSLKKEVSDNGYTRTNPSQIRAKQAALTSNDETNSSTSNLLAPGTNENRLSARVQSPMITLSPQPGTLVPLTRVSIDGEYVIPNEAFNGRALTPMPERDGDERQLADYIDIS